jgi:putative radical SAM enzyme (TIGR03279 family)
MRITRVTEGSPAWDAGLRAGDEIIAIDGLPVRDALEFTYLGADDAILVQVRRGADAELACELERTPGEGWGIELPEDPVRCCGNDCLFCFIDQNPRGLRPTLYVKDEDYRLSVLYGNYVTLTNLREWEIERIIAQHLSPLYVSVHATDPAVRRRLIRSRSRANIAGLMRRLGAGGIRMHAQIVLVPGYNDGEVLAATLEDLEGLFPDVASVAIVPVGLTKHRAHLTPLRELSAAQAQGVIDHVALRQERCLRLHGSRIHFLADEIYLLAGAPLPAVAAYEGFPQVENGVGMVRAFDEDLRRRARLFGPHGGGAHDRRGPHRRAPAGKPLRVAVVTGTLFGPLLAERLATALVRTGESAAYRVEVVAAVNELFGTQVTVAGLLSGADIVGELGRREQYDRVVLPCEMFNSDGFTLDHQRPVELARQLACPVQLGWAGEVIPA